MPTTWCRWLHMKFWTTCTILGVAYTQCPKCDYEWQTAQQALNARKLGF